VTLADAWQRLGVARRTGIPGAQFGGGLCGVALANMMFGLPPWFASHHVRAGGAQLLGEFIATFVC